jgi:hypothetical protein
MKLKALHEDILGDLKRKLKGQVSLADTIRRVAKQELKSALARVEALEDLLDRDMVLRQTKEARVLKDLKDGLKNAQKDLDRIK